MKKFIVFLTQMYGKRSKMVARKAAILSRVVLSVGLLSIALAAVMAPTGAIIVAALVLVLSAFCAAGTTTPRRTSSSSRCFP